MNQKLRYHLEIADERFKVGLPLNRATRRALEKGVSHGNNRKRTPGRKALGSLTRKKITFEML